MKRDPRIPPPGTVLACECKGRRLEVKVLAGGFEWEGVRYGSLSAVASLAYGCPANGYALFGLRPAAPKPVVAAPVAPAPPPPRKAGRPISQRRP